MLFLYAFLLLISHLFSNADTSNLTEYYVQVVENGINDALNFELPVNAYVYAPNDSQIYSKFGPCQPHLTEPFLQILEPSISS